MFEFAEVTKDMTASEILNYYRNLYYAEPQVTERGIVANAINDYVADVVPKSEVERLEGELIVESTRRKNAVNAYHEAIQKIAMEIFEEIEKVRMQHTFGDIDGSELNVRLYQLKKKYTEGKP
jgi:hypothetical protein